jgi:hypothetical protein
MNWTVLKEVQWLIIHEEMFNILTYKGNANHNDKPEWLLSRKQRMTNAGEDARKGIHIYFGKS